MGPSHQRIQLKGPRLGPSHQRIQLKGPRLGPIHQRIQLKGPRLGPSHQRIRPGHASFQCAYTGVRAGSGHTARALRERPRAFASTNENQRSAASSTRCPFAVIAITSECKMSLSGLVQRATVCAARVLLAGWGVVGSPANALKPAALLAPLFPHGPSPTRRGRTLRSLSAPCLRARVGSRLVRAFRSGRGGGCR